MKYKTKTPETQINFTDPTAGNRINSKMYNYLKPAQRVALKRKWARTEHKAPVYTNKSTLNSIVAGAKNIINGFQQVTNLESAGYKFKNENYDNFVRKLKTKFPTKKASPKPPGPSPRTERATKVRANFETYWKTIQPENRRMIRNYVAAYKSPNSNADKLAPFFQPAKKTYTLTNAKRNVNALKTAKARKEFYKRGTVGKGLNPNNLVELYNYIKAKNLAARNARAAKKSVAK